MNRLLALLSIEFASPIPVYEQLKKQIKLAIARQSIAPGDALPSIRELAAFLKINPNTVARTFRELAQEKIIDGRAGIGYWISTFAVEKEDNLPLLKEEFLKFLEKAVEMGFSRQDLKRVIDELMKEGK